jgi:DNA-binding CsgD family transcriptional regulator/heat shock protein HslJ
MSTLSPTPISMRERLRADYHWTPRQRQVLDLIAQGRSNPEIAAALDVSLQGAKWHVSEILDKLDARSREEAADYWRRYNGLAPRFARVFRGIATAAALKWTAAAVAVTAVAVGGIAIVAVAASNGRDDTGSPNADVSATPADDLLERLRANEWVLVDVAGVPARDDVQATFSLQPADSVPQGENISPKAGSAGFASAFLSCNTLLAGVDISGDRMTIVDGIRTLVGCAAGDQEERYVDVLTKAERFAFDGDQLLIFAVGYDLPLRFDPRSAAVPVTSTPPASTPPVPEEPAFEGTLAGIDIRTQQRDISPFEICPGVGLEPMTGSEARALVAGDGPLSIDLAALPGTVTLNPNVPPDVFTCRGGPVSVHATFSVAPGTAGVNAGGGSVLVGRITGPPQLASSHPRSAWTEVAVAGGTGIVLTTPTGSRGEGCVAAYWDEAGSVFTWIHGLTADAPFCELMLRAVVE